MIFFYFVVNKYFIEALFRNTEIPKITSIRPLAEKVQKHLEWLTSPIHKKVNEINLFHIQTYSLMLILIGTSRNPIFKQQLSSSTCVLINNNAVYYWH